ncbi:hypothetical protein HDU92_002367 [Lobulomyces angularis]|nr:hypothetical protein HDU92_002367 [Lobulomyces angularis]
MVSDPVLLSSSVNLNSIILIPDKRQHESALNKNRRTSTLSTNSTNNQPPPRRKSLVESLNIFSSKPTIKENLPPVPIIDKG